MDAHAVAEQARIEHEILKHITSALQVSLDWETSRVGIARKLSTVLFVAQCLQRHLEHQMTIEERDGYMSVVLESQPAWSEEIDALKQEHGQIREAMHRIVCHLESVTPSDELTFNVAIGEIRALLQQIAEHGNKEGNLLQKAFMHEEVAVD